jgi:hypothetical protein
MRLLYVEREEMALVVGGVLLVVVELLAMIKY